MPRAIASVEFMNVLVEASGGMHAVYLLKDLKGRTIGAPASLSLDLDHSPKLAAVAKELAQRIQEELNSILLQES